MVENAYNGDGRRVVKTVNGAATYYLYEYDKVILETNVYGDVTGRNVYGLNLLVRIVGVDTFYYMYNGHADVTALLTPEGTVAASYYYDAFGNILEQTGDVSNSVLFAGYQYDKETGLYYLNARMYDPVTARFMQEDTYAGQPRDPLSLNLYTYCHNSPLMYFDPTGHSAEYVSKSVGYYNYHGNLLSMDGASDNLAQREMRKAMWQEYPGKPISNAGEAAMVSAGYGGNAFKHPTMVYKKVRIAREVKEETDSWCSDSVPESWKRYIIIDETTNDTTGTFYSGPRTVGFCMRHPIAAAAIGTVAQGETNISTNAQRFASNDVVLPIADDDTTEGTQQNAVRHVLWQATITARFGYKIALEVGNAHEENPYALEKIYDTSRLRFTTLPLADEVVDLLNNQIGRSIGFVRPDTSMKDLAFATIDYYYQNGLWIVKSKKLV